MNDASRYSAAAALVIVIATALTVARLMEATPLRSANDRSRWSTVWSLVERDTYQIDEIQKRSAWRTIDRVRHEDHFYSSKPPLLPFLAAQVTKGVERVTGLSLEEKPRTTTRVVLLLINVLPTVLSWVALAWMLPKLAKSFYGCLLALSVACFASLNLPFLVTFNNHSVAIWSLTLTLACMTWQTVAGPKGRWAAAAFGGLFAAWTCCNELPAAPFGLLVFLWFLKQDAKTALLAFGPMAVVPLAGFFYTNYDVTGSWKPFYLSYGTETYRHVIDGVPSYWMRPQGLDTNPDDTPTYLLHCTVGHHGIWSLTPVYVLTVLTWLGVGLAKEKSDTSEPTSPAAKKSSPRSVFNFARHGGLFLTALTVGFFLSKTENYNYGGVSCALRWVLWLTPLWIVGLLPTAVAFGKKRFGRVVVGVLMAASVGSAWMPASNPWQHPWIYTVLVRAGVVTAPRPALAPVEPTDTWVASLPDTVGASATYRVDGPDPRTMTLETVSVVGDRSQFRLTIERNNQPTALEMTVDTTAFASNEPITKWLINTTGDREKVTEWLRGLPLARDYQPGRRAYVRVPAFDRHRSTWRLASRVYDRSTRRWTRRDVWQAADDELNGDTASDVPFGVVMMRVTVSGRDGSVIARETWELSEVRSPASSTESIRSPQN